MSAPKRPLSGAHREAIRRGCAASTRSQAARTRVRATVEILHRIGRPDLFKPRIRDAEIRRTLQSLAPTTDPNTTEGRTLRYLLALTPGALGMYLRRNREFLSPTEANGPSAVGTSA